MLKISDLYVGYTSVPVLNGISLEVPEGKIVTMLGANGAGKSTTLKAISGLMPAGFGSIRFGGAELAGRRPDEIVRMGIAHVPEGRLVFPGLTVSENIRIGSYLCKYSKAELKRNMEHQFALFPRLAERRGQLAGTMSGGEQQMLSIARALMSKPKLLMLDEPSLGLAPVIIDQIIDKITEINREGTTVLLIEQNAELALAISDWAYILSVGSVALSGPSSEIGRDRSILDAYLGG
ncbi:MAG: ABC transporter ATP-binding protein [Clostridiales bacterium]|nr:ABC transporter ATP-binding protein [Clostridiales bacterium]OPZ67008.1 MAG: High-affinity branched-chain amino acid transport ATP-binding protein LivF [Firmicutes bacterium ADurb.Bin467]